MARIEEVSTTLIDDIDGNPANETIKFAIDGKWFEIDLSKSNARRFRTMLKPFIEHSRSARRPGASKRTRASRATQTAALGFDPAEIRAWAKSKRIKIASRGRVPSSVVERWRAATKS